MIVVLSQSAFALSLFFGCRSRDFEHLIDINTGLVFSHSVGCLNGGNCGSVGAGYLVEVVAFAHFVGGCRSLFGLRIGSLLLLSF